MFSRKDAHKTNASIVPNMSEAFYNYLERLCQNQGLSASMLCSYDSKANDFFIISSFGIPEAPFNGSNKDLLELVLKDCFERHPKVHIHSIHSTPFWSKLSTFVKTETWQPSMIYFPIVARNKSFVLVGFFEKEKTGGISPKLVNEIESLIDIISYFLSAEETAKHLSIMEFYVKEVGHDIASSVQAIISKLRVVSRGCVEGQMAIEKIKEVRKKLWQLIESLIL